MQYCPKCQIKIRGTKARCPLCQGELTDEFPESGLYSGENAATETIGSTEASEPFAQITRPRLSVMLTFRIVTFISVSAFILLSAVQIIAGFKLGWIHVACLGIIAGWADVVVAFYYRSNILRMLTTQALILMGVSIFIDRMTFRNGWSVIWFIPVMFIVLVGVTFAVAYGLGMELYEYVLYPAFDVLASLLQIIPIAVGINKFIAPAVICMALMLILASSLVIFKGKMLKNAAFKYIHM